MRWINKKKWSNLLFNENISIYPDGASRTCSKFLFIPREINKEVRWLMYTKWKQIFHTNKLSESTSMYPYSYWRDEKWID